MSNPSELFFETVREDQAVSDRDEMTTAEALETLREHASETDRYLPTDRELDLAEAIRVVDAAGLLGNTE